MRDQYGRNIDYMRISITDRCNLRCRYCMPAEGVKKLDMDRILTYEEILQICRAAADLGISKFKVTGGEPLVRRGCPDLIRRMKGIPGVHQVTLTTNGQLLREYVPDLLEAGLDGVNVSLDSLREDRYAFITRGGDLRKTLDGIDAARAAGIRTKVNCVPQRGCNEDELTRFADLAFDRGLDVRFIELMPVGFGDPDAGISNEEVVRIVFRAYPQLKRDERVHGNGPAVYYHLPAKAGSIGFISAMHRSFCGSCNRIRLTSTGLVKPCLCYEDSIDLRDLLRAGRCGPRDGAGRESVLPDEIGAWDGAGPEVVLPDGTDLRDGEGPAGVERGLRADRGQGDDPLRQALRRAVEMKPPGHCFKDAGSVDHRSMMEIGG